MRGRGPEEEGVREEWRDYLSLQFQLFFPSLPCPVHTPSAFLFLLSPFPSPASSASFYPFSHPYFLSNLSPILNFPPLPLSFIHIIFNSSFPLSLVRTYSLFFPFPFLLPLITICQYLFSPPFYSFLLTLIFIAPLSPSPIF